MQYYRKAVEQEPTVARHWYLLGRLLLKLGEVEECMGPLERAAALSSDDPWPFNDLGVALMRQGRVHEAVVAFGKALERAPSDVAIQRNLARARRVLELEQRGDAGTDD